MADEPDVRAFVDLLLEKIGKAAEEDDYESAHKMEDHLHRAVLKLVVEGHPDAVELARKALTTDSIVFSRYYA